MNNISTKTYTNIVLLLSPVIILPGYFLLQETEIWHLVLPDDYIYAGLIPVTLVYLISLALVQFNNNIFKDNLSLPSVLFLAFMGYFIYLGTLDHYFQDQVGSRFVYNESINTLYYYIMISLSSWCFGYISGCISLDKLIRKKAAHKGLFMIRRWNKKRLKLLVLLFSLLGVASFAIFYSVYIKGFPVLQGISPNASAELRRIVSNEGHNVHLLAFNSMTMVLIYSAVYLIVFDKDLLIILSFIFAVIAFLLWGARIYIAIPFLMFLPYLIRVKKYPLKKVVPIILSLVVLGSMYGTVRNLSFYAARGQQVSYDNFIGKMASLHIAPEFRDSLGVVSYLDELQEQYSPNAYLAGIYYTAFPGKLLKLVGINKQSLFDENGVGSGWLIARVTRGYDWGGIRPGIMGQTLMAFGMKGVVFLFIVYGILFSCLDRLSKCQEQYSPDIVLVYILSGLFSFSVIGTTHSVFSKFWYLIYAFMVFYLFATKKQLVRRQMPLDVV